MAYFQTITNVPETFEVLADIALSRLRKCQKIEFVGDTYLDVSMLLKRLQKQNNVSRM